MFFKDTTLHGITYSNYKFVLIIPLDILFYLVEYIVFSEIPPTDLSRTSEYANSPINGYAIKKYV